MSRRTRDAEAELNLPPGFRFHPTDEELVVHYLCRKVAHQFLPVTIIAEVDLYRYDPWLLPERALFGHKEWYFFTPRDRKYPKGSRPNRAAASGYWKATGADKPVTVPGSSRPVGIKKALVFYSGKAPKGTKTNWIMHEYRLVVDTSRAASKKKDNLRLDDWVLCRLYNKKNNWEKDVQQQLKQSPMEDVSFLETPDSFRALEDPVSDSHRSPGSDIDSSDVFSEMEAHCNPSAVRPLRLNSVAATAGQMKVEEDSDWFMELNLDDLQNPFANMPSCQDYYRAGLPSPLFRRIPSQPTILPF